MSASSASTHETLITAPGPWYRIDFRELWEYRELLGFFVWRDFKVKYKQTALGFAWAILAPLISTVVFSVVFGNFGDMPRDGMPAGLYYLSGIIVWRYFQTGVTQASNSLVVNQALMTKVYVPRILIPASAAIFGLLDLLISFVLLLAIMVASGAPLTNALFWTPALAFLAFAVTFPVGLALASLNVKYRDIRHLVPFFLQIGTYCTIIVPFSQLPAWLGPFRYLYGLNPVGAIVEAFRWCVGHPYMDGAAPPLVLLIIGMLSILGLGTGCLYLFRKLETEFADVV